MKTTILLAATSILTIVGTHAENLQSAKITTLTNDVRLYQSQKFGRQAKVGDRISGHTSVQTGRRSRTELTFQDKTITRLGANSTFSFRRGSRDINLNRGSILLQVPKSAGGATIRTATVTAAITGTTLMMEYNVGEWVKLITLEGNVSLTIDGKKSRDGVLEKPKKVKVPAGKMIIMRPDGTIITKPVDIDLKRLLATSILAGNKIFAPLPKDARRHIAKSVDIQHNLKRKGILLGENHIPRRPGDHATKQRDTNHHIKHSPPPPVRGSLDNKHPDTEGETPGAP
ncbi:MAG: FecR family protein [Akkermansiaceae bacterium]|tara:strand:- start:941 stop:1798 length:858 start_codon:yes stop_codon:yes gene_type:complete